MLRVREALRRAFRGAGWAGACGGLLLALAVAVDQQAASDIETRRAAPTGIDRHTLQAFYQGFPPRSELPALLAALQVQAETHGIDVDRSDYRVSEEAGAPLLRVALSLPVRAEYGALYGWLSELIATAPHVALEAIALRRADARSDFVEGELRLLVFVNRGAP